MGSEMCIRDRSSTLFAVLVAMSSTLWTLLPLFFLDVLISLPINPSGTFRFFLKSISRSVRDWDWLSLQSTFLVDSGVYLEESGTDVELVLYFGMSSKYWFLLGFSTERRSLSLELFNLLPSLSGNNESLSSFSVYSTRPDIDAGMLLGGRKGVST